MSKFNYNLIKKQEDLIEEKRLAIKEEKNKKSKILNRMETLGNMYEYLANPACAISIALVALFTGPIIYVLPTLTAVAAVSITSSKFMLRRKADKHANKISKLKEERQKAYDSREEEYEKVFNSLRAEGLDVKDYYNQIVNASKACNELTENMKPYKEKKRELEKIRNIISNIFSYSFVPVAAVVLPLVCAFVDVGTMAEVSMLASSSAVLFGCSMADEKLSQKIEDLDDTIDNIKSDRTVQYVKRDLKLKEAVDYLASMENDKSRSINISIQLEKKKDNERTKKVTKR